MNAIKWCLHDAFFFAVLLVSIVVGGFLFLMSIMTRVVSKVMWYLFNKTMGAAENCISRYKKEYYVNKNP